MYYVYLLGDVLHLYTKNFKKRNQFYLQEVLEDSDFIHESHFWVCDENKEILDRLCSEREDIKYLGTLATLTPNNIIYEYPELFL